MVRSPLSEGSGGDDDDTVAAVLSELLRSRDCDRLRGVPSRRPGVGSSLSPPTSRYQTILDHYRIGIISVIHRRMITCHPRHEHSQCPNNNR
jgi:hypothetical protein